MKRNFYTAFLKRLFDMMFSLLMIIALAPLLLVIAVTIRIKLGSPVIFKQVRPGLNEKLFTLYKFRSMSNAKDHNGELLPDNIRLTKFGAFLRSTSLDELPQLFNILFGDMSLIGPRPLLVEYLAFYNPEEKIRHSVRPGMVSLASVRGRNALTWEQKLSLDIEYVKNQSFYNDVIIFLKTFHVVFSRKGVSKPGFSTTDKFKREERKDESSKHS